eukprot:2199434-Karenia_brevis.AAC.1
MLTRDYRPSTHNMQLKQWWKDCEPHCDAYYRSVMNAAQRTSHLYAQYVISTIHTISNSIAPTIGTGVMRESAWLATGSP